MSTFKNERDGEGRAGAHADVPRCGKGDEDTTDAVVTPLAVSIKRFCELTSLGRTTAFQLAKDGKIEIRRVNRRTLVLMRSVHALLDLSHR